MFIFHISDVHIDIDRIENLMNSFNILISRILEKGPKNSILLILGDIFENKTLLTTDDIGIFDYMMSTLYKYNIQTIIIIGNHDFNINSSHIYTTLTNNPLSLEILTKPYSNVKCLTYTQVYSVTLSSKAPELEFHVYSIVDNKIPVYTKNANIKIALLHDGVNGAKYDNGQTIEGMRFGVADFAPYDYVMLGDIHKPQFLTDNIAYCGSFVQKNRGEGIDHGYILWDLLQPRNTGFHFIPMKNVTIKITAYENQSTTLPDVPDSRITYVQLWHKKCSGEYISKLIEQIKAKYKALHRVVNRDFYDIQPIKTIDNLKHFKEIDHSSCIRELLKGHPDTDKIIEYHKSKLQNMRDINHVNYNINYLAWSNILCYGENNFINFSNLSKSIIVLNGKNKYGKSSIIDIIIRILFNECERGYKKDIVNKNKSSGHIKISISVGSDEYIAEQVMYKTGVDTQHRLYKNGENITKDTIIETYKYLGEIVGIGNYIDFVNMTTALQNRKFLVDMKEEEMLMLLIKLLNIEILEDINKQTKSRQKILSHDINKHNEELVRTGADIGGLLVRGGYFRGVEPLKEGGGASRAAINTGAHITPAEGLSGAEAPINTEAPEVIAAYIASRLVGINEIIAGEQSAVENANGQISALNKRYDMGGDLLCAEKLAADIASLKLYIGGRVANIGALSAKTTLLQNFEKEKVLLCAGMSQGLEALNNLTGGHVTIEDISPIYTDITEGQYSGLVTAAELLKLNIYKPADYIAAAGRAGKAASIKLIAGRSGPTSIEGMRAAIKKLYDARKPIDSGNYAEKLRSAEHELKAAAEGLTAILIELKTAGINPAVLDDQGDIIMSAVNITETTYKKYKEYISDANSSNKFVEFAGRCFDANYLENIKDKISTLKKLVFTKKAIISTSYIDNAEGDFLGGCLPKKAEYYDIITKALPDYRAVSDECAAITARLKKYNDNYGEMRFYDKCDCCAHNKSIISTIDISADNARLAYLSEIIAAKDITIKSRADATKCINLIERYESDIKANANIIENNKLFDELSELIEMYDLYNDISFKKNQIETYENIVAENIKISLVKKYKTLDNKQAELKILCADLSKKILGRDADILHNANINAEIYNLENELIEVEKATRYLSIINLSEKYDADYEQLLSTQNKILEYDTAKYSAKILAGKSGIEKVTKNINELVAEIDIINKYKEYEELKLKYESVINNKKILDEIEILKRDLSNKTAALTEHIEQQQSLIVWQATLSAKTQRLDELKKVISADESELTFLTLYQKCVDKKKGISQRILTDLCDRFNLECNKILHQISDFELEITVDSTQTLRIYTIDGGVKIPAAMASGYQKFVIDMIMRIVLTTILSGSYSNNMSNPNMLIIDEGFGCLDNKNFIEVAKVLKQLKDNFKCIVVITHINELKSYADETIEITRVNNYSRIMYHHGNIKEEPDDSDEKRPENPMLKMRILDEMAIFAADLAASRVEKNEQQAVRRAEIAAQKEAVIKVREESKASKAIESAKKKEEKNIAKIQAKAEKEEKKAEIERIITTPALLQPYIIEINETTCRCKACDKTFLYTERKILDHITSSTYAAKHRRYVKSVL